MTQTKLSESELQQIREEAEKYCNDHRSNCDGVYNYSIIAVKNAYVAAVTVERERAKEVVEALEECKSYFDDKADADHNGENFVPNDEMKILEYINQAINNYKKQ